MSIRARRTAAGMTLLEALVVVSLTSLSLAFVLVLFNFASRTSKASAERVDLHQAQAKVGHQLRRSLSNSVREGNSAVYLSSTTPNADLALALITSEDAAGKAAWSTETQSPIFQGYKIFYREHSDDTLRVIFHSISPTEVAKPLPEETVRDAVENEESLALAAPVQDFALFSVSDGSVSHELSNPIRIRWRMTNSRGASLKTEVSHKFPGL